MYLTMQLWYVLNHLFFHFTKKDLICSVIFFLGGNLQPNIPIENETLVISGGLSEGNLWDNALVATYPETGRFDGPFSFGDIHLLRLNIVIVAISYIGLYWITSMCNYSNMDAWNCKWIGKQVIPLEKDPGGRVILIRY